MKEKKETQIFFFFFFFCLLSSFFQSQFPYFQLPDNVDYHLLIQLFSSIEKSPSNSFHFPLVHHFDQMLGKTNSSLTPSNHPSVNFHYQSTPNVALLFDDQVEREKDLFSSIFPEGNRMILERNNKQMSACFFCPIGEKPPTGAERERVH